MHIRSIHFRNKDLPQIRFIIFYCNYDIARVIGLSNNNNNNNNNNNKMDQCNSSNRYCIIYQFRYILLSLSFIRTHGARNVGTNNRIINIDHVHKENKEMKQT